MCDQYGKATLIQVETSSILSDILIRCSSESENAIKTLIQFYGLSPPSSTKVERLNFLESIEVLSQKFNLSTCQVKVNWPYQTVSNTTI